MWIEQIDEELVQKYEVLQEEYKRLKDFSDEIINIALEGCDLDGDDLQKIATNHGLLEEKIMKEPCVSGGYVCLCQESDLEFPTKCLRKTYRVE